MAVDADTAGRQVSESSGSDSGVTAEPEVTNSIEAEQGGAAKSRMSAVRMAALFGVSVVVVLAALAGWLGFRTYQSHQAESQRQLFLQVGRQGALNLTTIDHEHADADIQRILDSATGDFYDDFSQRSQPFVEVVKKAKSKSVGTITEAGVESYTDQDAQVLVAVTVKTSNEAAAEQEPRSWRMRVSVTKLGDELKVANVEFVP